MPIKELPIPLGKCRICIRMDGIGAEVICGMCRYEARESKMTLVEYAKFKKDPCPQNVLVLSPNQAIRRKYASSERRYKVSARASAKSREDGGGAIRPLAGDRKT